MSATHADPPTVTRCDGHDNHPAGVRIPCRQPATVGWGHHDDDSTVWLCTRHFVDAVGHADRDFQLRAAP